MRLKNLEINGFKSFSKKTVLEFQNPIVAIVGPNGSGKSNVVEALRFVLGEQSMKSMRGSLGADLIFKGSKSLPKSSRATATIYFNNSDKIFKLSNETGEDINLNYDIISISREVFSDGLNKYILNGLEVRLKDINNLLSSVNIGSSGHHIISQGEADRILNASLRDRREMVEDALGLKIYQYKIKEAQRKLERTTDNMKEVSLLRRENAPHLNFLKKQVDKFEKAKEMQTTLLSLLREYLKKESVYLEKEQSSLFSEKNKIFLELKSVKEKISDTDETYQKGESEKERELKVFEKKISEIRSVRSEIERKLGRIEGIFESKKSTMRFSGKCPLCGSEIKETEIEQIEKRQNEEKELVDLKNSQTSILVEIENIANEEKKIFEKIEILKKEINQENETLHLREKEKFNFRVKHQELTSSLDLITIREENLAKETETFKNEIKEGSILIGNEILSYKNFETEEVVDRNAQEELRRKIERIKMKLEDIGMGGGSEVMKEYEAVSQRDNFLAKEMEDLIVSIESLRKLMIDLKEKIDVEFKEGIKKINVEFDKFFSLMFDGGTGYLDVVIENKKNRREKVGPLESSKSDLEEPDDEEEEPEQGIEINVSLPHKKV
ncbi:MAG: AAA family ATPase, partial [Patescibacteria group bacterium]